LIKKARGLDVRSGFRFAPSIFLKTPSTRCPPWTSKQTSSFIDIGDNTALVCVDHQQYQKGRCPSAHTNDLQSASRFVRRRRAPQAQTYNYDVVVIYENFKGSTLRRIDFCAEMDPGTGTCSGANISW